jgi:hypothetical protein
VIFAVFEQNRLNLGMTCEKTDQLGPAVAAVPDDSGPD